ncbi:GNAT family N-acetyltransferase [Microlunatus spumicola]|uniref:GNAT family N-acetyltransferase n=1 Tax=Microlunatus spumicola TaxID=81499 RepID=A0ABP6X0G4_9ACTN
MRLVEVDPDDEGHVGTLTRLIEVARAHDDPDAFVQTVEDVRNEVRYGGDLEPTQVVLLLDDTGAAVGHLGLWVPQHDNRHLVDARFSVVPDRRGQGFGTLLLEELQRRTLALGRTTLWIGVAADDASSTRFLAQHGFSPGSRDARRHQRLAQVDPETIAAVERDAAAHARDYVLERVDPPYDDAHLTALIPAMAAINDAPTGALTFEDEVFDLDRMREIEQARALRGERARRVLARHRGTGAVAGHTYLTVRPWAPTEAYQWDTSVARVDRGHRLGLALKIEMMRWLAETEPQLEVVETWNNADNVPMINVNEALGYRLSRTFATHQKVLDA